MTSTTQRTRPARTLLAASLLLAGVGHAQAQTATEVALARKLDQLTSELATLKSQLNELKQQRAMPAAATTTATTAPVGVAPEVPTAAASVAAMPQRPAEPATVLTSYGELNFNRPTRLPQNAQADMRRFVLGFQHRFDERTKVVAEVEVEHGVSSASDPGEVAIEQAYVEKQLTPNLSARAGLFLMPAGLLNENHEPTAYYGVERNFVETAIIPSTWREGGIQVIGNFDNGLTVQGGISTGFDLNKWDATSSEGQASPLGAIHQEMALAKSRDLAAFGAVNWRGVPGLLLGASLFTGKATHGQAAASSRITLWDVHARWTPGPWDLSALIARGQISNTAALNTPLVGSTSLIPASFDGAYVQAAYKAWTRDDYALTPFVRWETINTGRSYADLGPGLTPDALRSERVVTLGANVQVAQGVVLKADYQRFAVNPDLNRVDLGVGWSF